MLKPWSIIVNKKPWLVMILTLLLVLIAGLTGLKVYDNLNTGNDFSFPGTNSTLASDAIKNHFKPPQNQIILLFQSNYDYRSDKFYQRDVKDVAKEILATEKVNSVTGYYNTGSSKFVSTDGKQTFLVLQLSGSHQEQRDTYHSLMAKYTNDGGPFKILIGGQMVVNEQIYKQIKADLARAELISFPIVLILLIVIFGNVVAATVPVFLGFLSIVTGFGIVTIMERFTVMSPYVVNVVTLLGLGLAIDYSLFIVGRFREELKHTKDVSLATERVITRAGRTIIFSGLTVIVSFLSLTAFPQVFLHSVGLAGAAVVAAAVILANTVVPAALRLLGHKINKITVPGRKKFEARKETAHGFWYKFSNSTMRTPWPYLIVSLSVLVILALPLRNVHFSQPSAASLPDSFSSRQVNDQLSSAFALNPIDQITLIVKYNNNALSPSNAAALKTYMQKVSALQGVEAIDSYQNYIKPNMLGKQLPPALAEEMGNYVSDNYVQVSVKIKYDPQSNQAKDLVAQVRSISPPAGTSVYVGGTSASLVDLLSNIKKHAPQALAIIFGVTLLLIFFLTGGIIVPIKAIVLGTLSLSATFGLLVWVFQDHHLINILHVSALGSIDATSAVLIFAVAFGLSMDYEYFLLSRIREEYTKTGDNPHSIAYGVQRTAGIITSAAVLLIAVIALFTIGKISILQQIGFGLAVAVAIDASLIRLVLVPTIMRLLGRANWWAPKPLQWLYNRFSIKD